MWPAHVTGKKAQHCVWLAGWFCLASEQGTVHLERRDKGKGDRLPRAATGKVSWSIPAVVTEHKTGRLINSKNFMLMALEAGSPRPGHQHSRVGAPSQFIDSQPPTVLTWKRGLGALKPFFRSSPIPEGCTFLTSSPPKGPISLGVRIEHVNFGGHEHSDHNRKYFGETNKR